MARLKALPCPLSALPPALGYVDTAVQFSAAKRTLFSPWRKWYATTRWRKLRMKILARDLFTCQRPECGRTTADTSQLVADHRKPHRGDEALFWDEDNLQTLCKPCHDGAKQREERRQP